METKLLVSVSTGSFAYLAIRDTAGASPYQFECIQACPADTLNQFVASNGISASETIFYTDPASVAAEHVTICKKVVYANLPGSPSDDPCGGFYELNSPSSCVSSSVYYHCIAGTCSSKFVNQNKVCGKPITGVPATEDGAKHFCNSKFDASLLLGTTTTGISPQIRTVDASNIYTCYDNYCPASAPTLREDGICEGEFADCFKKSMKLTYKIAANDYRFYCLEDPTKCS